MKNVLLLKLLFFLFISVSWSQVNNTYNLLPVPSRIVTNETRFGITDNFRVSVSGTASARLLAEASRFIRRISQKTGYFLDKQGYVTGKDSNSTYPVIIKVNRAGKLELYENESYHLHINRDQVVISAETDIGAIRCLETLMQLVSVDEKGYYFPGLTIEDAPRFAWRGLLLDVALHFMPMDVVKRTLDGMAAVKMNVLHLHLSNDQGFRVESKVFPQLHKIASDGNYFTQDDIREIIAYADQRGIRVVPEFVVPAHTTAILTAFPGLASVKRDYKLERYFGVFDPVLDPTNENVYVFLDKLFKEMTSLFPDKYFHIGGDENTGKDWERNPRIRNFMKKNGMKTYMDLQSYFNKRIHPIIKKYKKLMMGWDEILQPGIPNDIVIQSWRGKEAFYESIKKGYPAILSNGYYIDLIQPASFHYLNDPIPDSIHLSKEESKRVLGGEATMWSEHVTPLTVDSRIWPRTAAIAERLWSPSAVNNVNDMYRRLTVINLYLDGLGLTHLSYKPVLLRRLSNSYDIQALEVLVNVIEPLKIYERNQGDTMYTVFSPYTKIADAATPDQSLPRQFDAMVDSFLRSQDSSYESSIINQLTIWKMNHQAFLKVLLNSPILKEAEILSENLSKAAESGLSAMQLLHQHTIASNEWLQKQLGILKKAKEQGGRCELQVIGPIEKIVKAVSVNDEVSVEDPAILAGTIQ